MGREKKSETKQEEEAGSQPLNRLPIPPLPRLKPHRFKKGFEEEIAGLGEVKEKEERETVVLGVEVAH